MGNYYRRFIRGYLEKVTPLVELTKQDVPFQWTKVCQERFDQLKEELAGCDIVAHPQDEGQFILDTDASGTTIGCVLSQVQDGKEKVIAYGSRMLSRTERNYCVTDREQLAVRFFMEYYRQYLLGRKFIVRTDHQALKWLFSLKEPKDWIARWLEIMSAYQFVVEYRPGKKHGNADAMSRRQCNPSECKCPVLDGDEEILKCGPCSKCRKRADTMDSSFMDEDGKARDHNTGPVGNNNKKPKSMRSQGTQTELSPAQSDRGRMSKLPKKKKHGRRGRKRGQTTGISRRCPGNRVYDMVCRHVQDHGNDTTITGPEREPWVVPDSAAELREKQLKDPDITPIMKWKEEGKRPFGPTVAVTSPATHNYWLYWDNLSLHDGVLFRKFEK